MPKVSIIIPLYNVEQYLHKCMETVLNQSLDDIEIILVNDGSPDRCGEIAENFRSKDSRIKVLHKENGGVCSARNAGLTIANGEYIGFVDPDDWIEQNMFEMMYNNALDNDADMVVCNYNCVHEKFIERDWLNIKEEIIDLQKISLSEYYYNYFLLYTHGDVLWNKIYRHSIIKEHSIEFESHREVFADDTLFNLYFLFHTKKISEINSSFYNYFQRNTNSITSAPKPYLPLQYINLIEKFVNYAENNGDLRKINKIPAILLLMLLRDSISYLPKAHIELELKKMFKDVSKSKNFKPLMRQLAFGNALNTYCNKTNQNFKSHLYMRIYAGLCFFGLHQILPVLMKYESFKVK